MTSEFLLSRVLVRFMFPTGKLLYPLKAHTIKPPLCKEEEQKCHRYRHREPKWMDKQIEKSSILH